MFIVGFFVCLFGWFFWKRETSVSSHTCPNWAQTQNLGNSQIGNWTCSLLVYGTTLQLSHPARREPVTLNVNWIRSWNKAEPCLERSFSSSLYARSHFSIKVFAFIAILLALREGNQFHSHFTIMEDVFSWKMPIQVFKNLFQMHFLSFCF